MRAGVRAGVRVEGQEAHHSSSTQASPSSCSSVASNESVKPPVLWLSPRYLSSRHAHMDMAAEQAPISESDQGLERQAGARVLPSQVEAEARHVQRVHEAIAAPLRRRDAHTVEPQRRRAVQRAAAEREPREAQPSNSLSYERLQLAVQVAREIRLVEGPQVLQHAIEPRGLLLRPRVQIWRRARWPLGLPLAACALGVHVSQPEEDCHAARP